MSDQWRADLKLLRAWAGSWDALAEHLSVSADSLRAAALSSSGTNLSDNTKQAIRDLRERWEDEHTQSAERYALVEQVLLQLKDADDMADIDCIVRRTEAILDKKDHALCD